MQTLKRLARSIFEQALADSSIEQAFERMLRIANGNGPHLILSGDEVVALDPLKHVRVIAMGKAAPAMMNALLSRLPLPPSCDLQGVLIAPQRPQHLPASIRYFPGGHPTPTQASFAGAAAAIAIMQPLKGASPEDTLSIFLISGGGSSMMELPLDPSISLEDTIAFHHALVLSGASIVEINCVRKHFSAVKGGRLAIAAGMSRKISLLVSDVPPAHLDALASGPTTADPTTVAACREILARYQLIDHFPESVRRFFLSANLTETPKPGELISPAWKLLDSDELAHAAERHAAEFGFHVIIDNGCDDWTYDAAADYLLSRLRQLRRQHSKVCLISVGEVTVRVTDTVSRRDRQVGIGGRNQHLALYIATQLRDADVPIAVLSAGSDGIDGNSNAAGGLVDEDTLNGDEPYTTSLYDLRFSRRASALQALHDFDSSTWLNSVGATIVTGPTGHNLRDLRILLADR